MPNLTGLNLQWISWILPEILLHILIFLLVAYHCIQTRKEPAAAVLWMFIAWSFPIFGPVLFLIFGVNRVPRRAWHKQVTDQRLRAARQAYENEALPMAYWRSVHESLAAEPQDRTARELNNVMNAIMPDYPLLAGNAIIPLLDGDEAFPLMMAAIRNARKHIHVQTFIIGADNTGRMFLDLLAERARSGITVRLLYDRFGSTPAVLRQMFRPYRHIPNMQICGWTQANALKRQFLVNLRNHRKIMVVDGSEAFTGGINLHRENITRPEHPPIRDYHFHLTGPIVQELQYSFLRDWYFMTNDNPEILLQQDNFPHLEPTGSSLMRLANSGPTPDENGVVADLFFECLASARRQVLAVTPYFVPTQSIIHAFRSAALRGADVRLLLPEKNNHIYAGLAGRSLYEELLRAGVRIFHRRPPFMHAKAFMVDDHIVMIGSANLDIRSLQLNYETNLLIFDRDFADKFKPMIINDLNAATEIRPNEWRSRPGHRKLMENFCHLLSPIL
ncbi:MAG: cardiolipin synthase [Kiritimatiellia bacterium]|nr:cardiolipin synthase [Lentisphaerota bacterium]